MVLELKCLKLSVTRMFLHMQVIFVKQVSSKHALYISFDTSSPFLVSISNCSGGLVTTNKISQMYETIRKSVPHSIILQVPKSKCQKSIIG